MATAGAFAVAFPLLLRTGLRASGASLERARAARDGAGVRARRGAGRRPGRDPVRARPGHAARRWRPRRSLGVLGYWAAYYGLVLDPGERELVRGLLPDARELAELRQRGRLPVALGDRELQLRPLDPHVRIVEREARLARGVVVGRAACRPRPRRRTARRSRARSRPGSRAGGGSRRSARTPPSARRTASPGRMSTTTSKIAPRAQRTQLRHAAAGSASRAARRAPSASGCPGRSRRVMPSSASAFAREVSTKKPRSSPCTAGSRRIGPSRLCLEASHRRGRLVEPSLDAVGDQPRERQRRGGRRRRRVAHVERALGLRDDEVVDQPCRRGRAPGRERRRTTGVKSPGSSSGHVVRGLAREARGCSTAWRSSRSARAPPAARHAPACRARRASAPQPRGREQRARPERHVRRRCGGSGERRGTAAPGPGPDRSARAPGAPLRPQAAGRRPGTARCAGPGRRRPPPPAGRPRAPRRTRRSARGVSPRRAQPMRRSARAEPRTPVSHRPPRRPSSAAKRARHRGEIDDSRLRRVQRRDAARVRLDLPQPSASTRRSPGTPFARPRRSSSSSRASSLSSRATISLPRARTGRRAPRSTRTGRARPRRTAAP